MYTALSSLSKFEPLFWSMNPCKVTEGAVMVTTVPLLCPSITGWSAPMMVSGTSISIGPS